MKDKKELEDRMIKMSDDINKLNMIIDFSWSGGLVFGILHTDTAIVETGEDEFQFCSAIIVSLGFFNISFLFL